MTATQTARYTFSWDDGQVIGDRHVGTASDGTQFWADGRDAVVVVRNGAAIGAYLCGGQDDGDTWTMTKEQADDNVRRNDW